MRAPRPWFLLLVLLSGLAGLPAAANPSGGPLDSLKSGLETLADPQRAAATEALDAASAADREAAVLEQRLQALNAEVANAPARTAQLEAQLALDPRQALAQWRARVPAQADVETLERLLEQERLATGQLRDRIESITTDLADAVAQPAREGSQLAELQRRIDELSAPIVPGKDEPAALSDARRVRQAAERRQLQADLALRQAQQDLAGTRQRLQELELRALRTQLAQREPRLAVLQQRIAERGRGELEAQALGLAERAEAVAGRDDPVAGAVRQNLAFGQELLSLHERLDEQRRSLATQEQALARDLAGLRDSRTRLELGGRSEQVGIWLWAELRRLEPERSLRERLDTARQSLAELRLRLIELSETRRQLDDLPAAVRALRDQAGQEDDDGTPAEQASASELERALQERLDLVTRIEPTLWRLVAAHEQAERTLQSRLDANLELRQTLDRHLLWIRSHAPVGADWLATVPAGLYDLFKPTRLVTTGELLLRSLQERPWSYVGAVAVVAVLLVLRRRARPKLESLAQAIREVRADRYRRTLESLAWTALAALPGAVALWLLGGLLQGVGTSGKYSDSLGRACAALALPMFTLAFLRWLVRERGLAHAHFRWTKPRREALRRWLPRLSWGLLPLYFVVALAFIRNQELAIAVQARLAIVAASLFSGWVLWRLLAPDALWHSRGADVEPSLRRRVLRFVLPAMMLACAVLALDGYVYTTAILLNAQFASVGMVTAVAVLHGLLSRWFVLGERRLALRRLEQKREAEKQARSGEADPGDGGEAVPMELEEEITLEKVNAHSRSLLRAIKLTLLVVGLAWVWSDVLLAFARFDEIALWSITESAADGGSTDVPITLMAVLLGVLALALTVVAARNLPGLIEIGLLSKVNIDAASRYAITSVSRYAIVLVGVVIGLGLLGLRWGQLQWMAAALTVGLGFGLQEIFANFVSGLILLFERPFRVGDVITVNNLDGTVTRIRTRATTILDFDNKEIVVPNKTFITGQLVNWTLTDETTRITIKVGVDYGTDPALVHRLLLQAAEENPRVLKDWPPRSWLLAFGASTLDFELRVFVGAMGDRLAVRNEINARLVELFDQNGIAFAYPQLDVHVRDLPARRPRQDPREPAQEPAPGR